MNNFPAFQTKTFGEVYATQNGEAIWQLLNDAVSVARMQAVSDVNKPALLGVERLLLTNGYIQKKVDGMPTTEKAQYDRLKQMLGSMVRQVMENNGYKLKSNNVKTPNSDIFFSASAYEIVHQV